MLEKSKSNEIVFGKKLFFIEPRCFFFFYLFNNFIFIFILCLDEKKIENKKKIELKSINVCIYLFDRPIQI